MKNRFKIFANYGVLAAEKRTVYSYMAPQSDIYDDVIVDIYNQYGSCLVETTWGDRYTVDDVLNDLHDKPLFNALENGNKWHRVYLNIIEDEDE